MSNHLVQYLTNDNRLIFDEHQSIANHTSNP